MVILPSKLASNFSLHIQIAHHSRHVTPALVRTRTKFTWQAPIDIVKTLQMLDLQVKRVKIWAMICKAIVEFVTHNFGLIGLTILSLIPLDTLKRFIR